MTSVDPETFRRLLAGWPNAAITILIRFYFRKLVNRSYAKTRNLSASEDIAQEVINYIWEYRTELSARADFQIEPYLFMLVRHKSITWYRKHKGRPVDPLVFDPEDNETPEEAIIREDEAIRLWGTLRLLPNRERECMLLRFMEEWPYKRIAQALGISIKAVERNLTSGKKRLQKYAMVRVRK